MNLSAFAYKSKVKKELGHTKLSGGGGTHLFSASSHSEPPAWRLLVYAHHNPTQLYLAHIFLFGFS